MNVSTSEFPLSQEKKLNIEKKSFNYNILLENEF